VHRIDVREYNEKPLGGGIVMEVDVVIIGSGAAGLTTAVVAAQAGLKVLVTEKAKYYGGTTAVSLGAPWIIANPHQKSMGLDDDAKAGDLYLRSTLGNLYNAEKVAAYNESGAEMIGYMEANTKVRWRGTLIPDYFLDAEGFRLGRMLLTREYDGSVLGPYLRQLRLPLPGFSVFGSMLVDYMDVDKLKATFKSPAASSSLPASCWVMFAISYASGAGPISPMVVPWLVDCSGRRSTPKLSFGAAHRP
jgi:hypothetical protein